MRPAGSVLHMTQNRIREKTFLAKAGIPVTPFTPIDSRETLLARDRSARLSRDSEDRGLRLRRQRAGLYSVVRRMPMRHGMRSLAVPAVLERFIDFEREISVVAARGLDGSFAYFPPSHNEHQRQILDISVRPRVFRTESHDQAVDITRRCLRSSTSSACSASSSS